MLKRHLDFPVSHIVDGSILGSGYWVVFMVLTIRVSLFTASLDAEDHRTSFSSESILPSFAPSLLLSWIQPMVLSMCCNAGEGFLLWREALV